MKALEPLLAEVRHPHVPTAALVRLTRARRLLPVVRKRQKERHLGSHRVPHVSLAFAELVTPKQFAL